jgi:hypothetical protein
MQQAARKSKRTRGRQMYDGRMFESVAELWKEYLSLVSGSWPESDVRHNLGGEVRDRLRRIDLILRHLREAISAVTPDPVEDQKWMESFLANLVGATRGEITQEEFDQASVRPVRDPSALIDSWDDIWIFTETFYFSAWRLLEILNRSKPYAFPGLGRVNARAITIVRNHLIEHPGKTGDPRDFTLSLVILSSGPALRSSSAVLRLDSMRIDPSPDGKDHGLFVAAEELRDEVERRFSRAISEARLKALLA